jgi:DivIVA domain-containing protein
MAVDETSLERIRKATFPAARRGYDKREVEKFLNRLADWLETGGGDQTRSDTVRRELERVGQRTGAILAEAEESARQIRAEAEQEMAQLATDAATDADKVRTEADTYAAEARAGADGYSKETRAEADGYAQQTRTEADGYDKQARAEADSYAEQARAEADGYAQETRATADSAAEQARASGAHDAQAAIDAADAHARRLVDEGVLRRKDIESVIGDLAGRRDQAISGLETLRLAVDRAIGEHKPAGADPFAPVEEFPPLEGDDAENVEDAANVEDAEALAVANAGEPDAERADPEGFEDFEKEPAGDGAEAETVVELEADAEPEAEAQNGDAEDTGDDGAKPAKKRRSRARKTAASSKGKR